jgi:ribosome-binding protein aMBF1 (putative translation factor)
MKTLLKQWNYGGRAMPEPEVEDLGNLRCRICGAEMRLFGIEAHPIIDGADLRTYVCPRCDALETETVPTST